MSQETAARRCVMCTATFNYAPRPGRPPSFCGAACRSNSKRTPMRYCIICMTQWDTATRPNTSSPFYCSDECQHSRRLCKHCGMPSTSRFAFCSAICMQAEHPGPYTCTVCQSTFAASEYFLNKEAARTGPPRYCGSDCYTNRHMPHTTAYRPNMQHSIEWKTAFNQWDAWRTDELTLPTRNGTPYTNITPTLLPATSTLHPKLTNTINFWTHALTTDLLPTHDAAQIYYSMCYAHPYALHRAHGVFPWVQQAINNQQFDAAKFANMARMHVHAQRTLARSRGAMTKERMTELLMRAQDNMKIWEGVMDRVSPEQHKEAMRWINKWLKPNGGAQDGMTRLQMEAMRYMSTQTVDINVLLSLWDLDRTALDTTNEVIKEYFIQHWTSKRALPWGADLRKEILAAQQPNALDRLLDAARGGRFTADPTIQARLKAAH